MRGFTLLEMLVVVAIVAIATSALVVKLWPDGGASAETEARRLAALLESAQWEARVSGQPIAWSPEANGYAFVRRGGRLYAERRLDAAVRLEGERVVLMPYGLAPGMRAALSDRRSTIVLRSGALGRVSLERLHAD